MTPSARVQAAIELLDSVIRAAREGGAAADTLIARYFAERRYAGSKDRRAVRELVYAAIRAAGPVPESGRAAMVALARRDAELAALFDGQGHGPAPIAGGEPEAAGGVAPTWLLKALKASGLDAAGQAALLERAPLDLRVNTLKSSRDAELARIEGAEATPWSPVGLRLPSGASVEQSESFREGAIEVQDEGSQLVSLACGAEGGMIVLDLCAGGGGKTLALAAAMANKGRIVASDTDRGRLSKLTPRAERAGVSIVETRLLNPGREMEALAGLEAACDLVVVDAPCSGTGTWRRNPEARWRLTPDRLTRFMGMQARLLDLAAEYVRPGGALVHIVCSLLDAEGKDQAEGFLARHAGWTADAIDLPTGEARGPGLRLTPMKTGTDGFFVARLRRP